MLQVKINVIGKALTWIAYAYGKGPYLQSQKAFAIISHLIGILYNIEYSLLQ